MPIRGWSRRLVKIYGMGKLGQRLARIDVIVVPPAQKG